MSAEDDLQQILSIIDNLEKNTEGDEGLSRDQLRCVVQKVNMTCKEIGKYFSEKAVTQSQSSCTRPH